MRIGMYVSVHFLFTSCYHLCICSLLEKEGTDFVKTQEEELEKEFEEMRVSGYSTWWQIPAYIVM